MRSGWVGRLQHRRQPGCARTAWSRAPRRGLKSSTRQRWWTWGEEQRPTDEARWPHCHRPSPAAHLVWTGPLSQAPQGLLSLLRLSRRLQAEVEDMSGGGAAGCHLPSAATRCRGTPSTQAPGPQGPEPLGPRGTARLGGGGGNEDGAVVDGHDLAVGDAGACTTQGFGAGGTAVASVNCQRLRFAVRRGMGSPVQQARRQGARQGRPGRWAGWRRSYASA